MWAVRTIPEVFCMFSIHFHAWMYSWSCWKIMQHLRLLTPPPPSRADCAHPLHVITFEKIISHHISGLISTRSRLSVSLRFAGDNSGEKFTSSLIKAYEIRASASAKTFHERAEIFAGWWYANPKMRHHAVSPLPQQSLIKNAWRALTSEHCRAE